MKELLFIKEFTDIKTYWKREAHGDRMHFQTIEGKVIITYITDQVATWN